MLSLAWPKTSLATNRVHWARNPLSTKPFGGQSLWSKGHLAAGAAALPQAGGAFPAALRAGAFPAGRAPGPLLVRRGDTDACLRKGGFGRIRSLASLVQKETSYGFLKFSRFHGFPSPEKCQLCSLPKSKPARGDRTGNLTHSRCLTRTP